MYEDQTFAVGIYGLGRRMVGFPFGRLKFDANEIVAWSWPRGRWIQKRIIRKADVACIGISAPYRVVRLNIDKIRGLGWRPTRSSAEALREAMLAMLADLKSGRS